MAKKPAKDYEALGKMVAAIHDSGYLDHKEAYKMSFLKGVLGGLGGVIGATIVVALLLWILSLLNNVPLLDRFSNNIQETLDSQTK